MGDSGDGDNSNDGTLGYRFKSRHTMILPSPSLVEANFLAVSSRWRLDEGLLLVFPHHKG